MARGATIKLETPSGFAVERRLVTRQHRLEFDRARCLGCEICPAICPQEAIQVQPGEVRDGRLVARPSIDVNPARCNFCGECVVLCPTRALGLLIDEKAQNPIVEMDVFPRLEQEIQVDVTACRPTCGLACEQACSPEAISVRAERGDDGQVQAILDVTIDLERCTYCTRCAVFCPEAALTVRKPWRGRIRLLAERCPEDCQACADLCPNSALLVQDGRVVLDERFCIYCGGCTQVCPAEGALTIVRSGVLHTPIRSGAWFEALEKLVSPGALAAELDAAAHARRRQAAAYLPGVPGPDTRESNGASGG